jgi:hypothetical protein
MPKRVLTVTYAGQDFTRETARDYTHVVLIKRHATAELAVSMRDAAEVARINYPYYVREAKASTREFQHASSELARFEAIAAMTEDEFVALCEREVKDKVMKAKAAGVYDRYECVCWCGRLDLAEKEASSQRRWGHAEVVVVPVPKQD